MKLGLTLGCVVSSLAPSLRSRAGEKDMGPDNQNIMDGHLPAIGNAQCVPLIIPRTSVHRGAVRFMILNARPPSKIKHRQSMRRNTPSLSATTTRCFPPLHLHTRPLFCHCSHPSGRQHIARPSPVGEVILRLRLLPSTSLDRAVRIRAVTRTDQHHHRRGHRQAIQSPRLMLG